MTYPRYYIKFIFNHKPIRSLHTSKSSRIVYLTCGGNSNFKWNRAYLKIRYTLKYYNDGYYTNKKDLMYAFKYFREIEKEFKRN